jgi:hypothetical protein
MPLQNGPNTFDIVATTLPGATATAIASATGSQGTGTLPLTITVDRPSGYAPAQFTFAYSIGALPLGATVHSVIVDFDSDGAPDYSGPSLTGAPTTHTYTVPGVYTASIAVIDSNGNSYQSRRAVAVVDFTAQRSMLCDVYGYLKARLNARDAEGAASAYQPESRDAYSSLFNAAGSSMPSIASELGVIAEGMLGNGFSELTIVRDNDDQTRNGFPLRMTQGSDGVWRIAEM